MRLSDISRTGEMKALIGLLAARSGQLLRPAMLGNETGLAHPTVSRYLELLELVFLIKRIPAWSRNLSRRATSTPKMAMVDSGVAANLLGMDAARLIRPGAPFGPVLVTTRRPWPGPPPAWPRAT